ncbi:DUF3180 domain-containing protein [Aeromicrobium sp.]|uniref:DUF3180 domain-containing protein n=1 Tax=Aeromicrobium sp. TaxID=1871063 RepID=UPI0019B79F49|nr:DUF3180 domain-containing protein [Aeromicrobium sp.]MBC7631427.1 DUF3180 family protein [Aeromicrobium sp.]
MNRVKRTSAVLIAALIGGGVVVGRLLPPLIVRSEGNVPRVSWASALTLLLGAAAVGVFAWSTWQSLHKKHERMTADYGIKMLSLGKSAAVVGALVSGVYGGFALAFIDATDVPLGKERFLHAGAASIAGVLLLVAGLLLERACQLPDDDDDDAATPA